MTDPDSTKVCTKCSATKPLADFPKGRNRCYECGREYRRRYYEENKEKAAEYARRYREENREAIRARTLRWQRENRETLYKRIKQWADRNRDKTRAATSRWQRENPEAAARNGRAARARRFGAPGEGATLSELIAIHGELCYLCGAEKATQVEHMTPLSRGGTNYPENLRPACLSCNYSKGDKTYEEFVAWRLS